MKTLFTIGNLQNAPKEGSTLLIELGDTFCMVALLGQEGQSLFFFQKVTFEETNAELALDQFLSSLQIPEQSYAKVVVCSAFPQAVLVPQRLYNDQSGFIATLFDVKGSEKFKDVIGEWQIVNLHLMPVQIKEKLKAYFPSAVYLHMYTPFLRVFNGFTAPSQISVHFVSNQFRVVVRKEGELQLVQAYSYTAPLDVVYYLLKICTEFGMTQEDTLIILSGFIEENSPLYTELYNYFLNLNFTESSVQLPEEGKYPKHYFTSLHNLAACVS